MNADSQNAGASQQDQTSFAQPPSISLPKGGGAIRGIGEKFAANPVTGTGSMTVPIFTSPGRSGFGPELVLSYDSGSGNGPFGFGWSLSLPSITRKTDKGLPRYLDSIESDTFILSGSEDLVPVLDDDGTIQTWNGEIDAAEYEIRRYRPRIEGLFARIERWTRKESGEIHWRSISKENVTTLYGQTAESRIADPADPIHRVFSWLICETHDDKGNVIVYEYEREDFEDVEWSDAHEIHRKGEEKLPNRYLKRIYYGNKVSRLADDPTASPKDCHFKVVFDYGEEHEQEEDPEKDISDLRQAKASFDGLRTWPKRVDPFSSYRAGFEVRTYRLCRRVLMFHHFPDELTWKGEPVEEYLVRSTEFDYEETPVASFIKRVSQSGYVLKEDSEYPYLKKSLPPLEFEYTRAEIHGDVEELVDESVENLPQGLDGSQYRWVDLDGEGLSGVLAEQAHVWFYKPNLGNGTLGAANEVAVKPSTAVLNGGGQQLMDLAGDGQLDLVDFRGPTAGFYERTKEQHWERFKPFVSLPNLDWGDPNLKFVDLTGDGHADALITENEVLTWYASLGEDGFDEAERVHKALEEQQGPRAVFADGTQSIYLADMSGDGLSDIARIRNGEVCYWPNLGYGRFGKRVTMSNAPTMDEVEQFDQRRVRLADIDGSGTTDILYLGRESIDVYRNESGNGWEKCESITKCPRTASVASVMPVDLMANGTACLVWSSPLAADARRPMRYIDLMGGVKPHLLTKVINNLGAETEVQYAASTKFYLDDRNEGRPWITRLPFPVHVVERVITHDRISRNRFVTRYAYHHGYFDGIEREFRGFGLVEQWDTEEFAALTESGNCPDAVNLDEASHVPPMLTKTWFHTGAYVGRESISKQYESEYYREGDPSEGLAGLSDEDYQAMLLPDTLLPSGLDPELTSDEAREACRALKGSILRQETYACDGTEAEDRPYSVSERNYTVKRFQHRGRNRHAVFYVHPRETVDFHYERKLFEVDDQTKTVLDPRTASAEELAAAFAAADPRVTHSITLAVDDYGNVKESVAIGYGRRFQHRGPNLDPDVLEQLRETQAKTLITYTENDYTNPVLQEDDSEAEPQLGPEDSYRKPLPAETRTYEIVLVGGHSTRGRSMITELHRFSDMVALLTDAKGKPALPYEVTATPHPPEGVAYRRLIEHVRTYHRRNNLSASLALGELQSMALPFESYKLAFTPGLVANVFGDRVTDAMLEEEGRYVHTEGDTNWWIPSGRIFYSPGSGDAPAEEEAHARQHFFLPHRYRNPFHTDAASTESFVTYDPYNLLIEETRDALDNRVTVGERHVDPTQPLVGRGQDYRVLQPTLVMDSNRNCSEVRFDALGMVAGTAAMGKPAPATAEGDSLEGFRADLTQSEIDQFVSDPKRPVAETLLANATNRVIYDLMAYVREPDPAKRRPAMAATLARETHASEPVPEEGLRIQVSFSYSDGFGREIQKKVQAESGSVPRRDASDKIIVAADGQPEMTPHEVSPRWVGSGWTVFNNKGKAVRQYEPFFTDSHRFEFEVRIGVSPVFFYDPAERVVATLHPNHTWEKVVFDPWRQETWDVNDTVLTDPCLDEDLKSFVQKKDGSPRLPDSEYLPSWHALRTDAAHAATFAASYPSASDRAGETRSARKTEVHTSTPTAAHADSLGRTFLTVAHNRFKYSNTDPGDLPVEGFHSTRIVLDIEGNQREVIDAKDRFVMRYHYDMLGNRVQQASMEAGVRWMLNDVAGKTLYAWDSRDHRVRTSYDALRRPTDSFLCKGAGAEILIGRTVYGETEPNASTGNLRGKVFQVFDQAGATTSDPYDFKGNLLSSARQLVDTVEINGQPAPGYKNRADWNRGVSLMAEKYVSQIRFDALNRPTQVVAPHSDQPGTTINVIQPTYSEASLLEKVDVWLNRNSEPGDLLDPATANLHAVSDIDYDAKGQRLRIDYGNDVRTTYVYDPLTYRLARLHTERGGGHPQACATELTDPGRDQRSCPKPTPVCQGVQNLHYTYDPAGNITGIRDEAQQTVFFRNRCVEPSAEYTYDAAYRLIEATGREHIGQVGGSPIPHSYNDALRIGFLHPSDGNAMGRYCECYEYDAVGNIMEMIHRAACPGAESWRRSYTYAEPSLIEPGKQSNRLTSTTIGATTETYSAAGDGYDAHGNMLRMLHLQVMQWNIKDQLQMTQRQKVNDADEDGELHHGERIWYVYDSSGQRVRKVTERANRGGVKDERIYMGGFEIYRRHSGANAGLMRETLHIMDDKQLIALVETRTQGNEPDVPQQLIRYQIGNHLGSATLELDDQALIISYEEYTPYGSTAYQAVRSQTETPKRYRFTGKERDEESGLYYHGARYYAPWLGRWIAADPAGIAAGPNLYWFADDSPLTFVDPDGCKKTPTAADLARKWSGSEIRFATSRLKRSSIFRELDTGAEIISFSPNEEYTRNVARIRREIKARTAELMADGGISESTARHQAEQGILHNELLYTKFKSAASREYRLKTREEFGTGFRYAKAFKDENKIELYMKQSHEARENLVEELAHEYSHIFDPEPVDDAEPLEKFHESRSEIFAELFSELILAEVRGDSQLELSELRYGKGEQSILKLSHKQQERANEIFKTSWSATGKAIAINNLVKYEILRQPIKQFQWIPLEDVLQEEKNPVDAILRRPHHDPSFVSGSSGRERNLVRGMGFRF